ncbi:hypothetical protein I5M27_07665 [Adhaeribacter sp. BT258]|uniref:Outer membrane protein beta-barrel domain-containing protein n=1 Tax=Adhaeribacter terrigena TaxID=2793070 RepID=A0ABS1C2R4_9BACT|nr:outer membrane beta-barrel protein [Adhaeribacter terrigena]MBK0402860.1 hypothetical protein [Adhaeribacter terrigena]
MRKLIILLSLVSFTTHGFAQTETLQEKSFLTIRAGISMPTGKFGSLEGKDIDAGLALKGYNIAAEYGRYFSNYTGLGLTFGMRRNAIDMSAYNRSYFTNYYAETRWRTNYLLTNLYLKLLVSTNFNFYAKGGAGVTFNTYPVVTNSISKATSDQKITADALAYGFGAGFKGIIDNIGLGLEVYSLNTTPSFRPLSADYKQEMNDVTIFANLSFQLK